MQIDENGNLSLNKEISLLPYKPRAFIEYEEMTNEDVYSGSGDLVFDSECYPNYFLAAFRHIQSGRVIKFTPPFDNRKLSFVLHRYRCIGFNSLKYDIPLLWAAYKNQDPKWLKNVSNDLVGVEWYQEIGKKYEIQIFKTDHIDLIEVCPLRGSLKLYGARLHTKRIQELPYHHMKLLNDHEKQVVTDYCINGDLPATAILFNELKEQLELRSTLSREYKIDVMSKSDAQIAESIIGSEIKKITGKWPSKPKNFDNELSYQVPHFIQFQTPVLNKLLENIKALRYEVLDTGRLKYDKDLSVRIGEGVYRFGAGGLHSSEKNTSCKSNNEYEIIDKDVASYYPAIVLILGLFPEHIGPVFLEVYRKLVERRISAKKALLIAISECLKICINGTFGKTGSPYSILYAPQMMIQITLTGQLALLMLIEDLELNEIAVYSANTDGIVIKCPRDKKDLMNAIVSKWEKATGFQTEETIYQAIYSRDVNAYMAIKPSGEVKGKNVYYDPWRAKTARDLYWRFQKNPVAQICIEAIENKIVRDISIQDTIKQSQDLTKFVAVRNVTGGAHKDREYLGKVIRYYWAKNIVGTIKYIKSNNDVPDTEGAKPCLDMPDEFPNDINYDWYVAKTTEMLYDMDYLKRPQQLRFF